MILFARVRFVTFVLRCAALAGCVFMAGCGQGAYEARLHTTVDQLEHEAKFKALRLAPVPILGTQYMIRLPNTFFGNTGVIYTLESQNPLTGEYPIPPEMLQPPFMTIPGVKALYQAAEADERGVRLPYFLYMASIDRNQEPAEPVSPATEATPADENKPAEENRPAEENKPADENKPAEEAKPAEGNKPEAAASADEKKPADEEKKAEGEGEKKPDQKPAAKPKPVPLDEQLAAVVNKAFGGKTPLKWETVECETPQDPGTKITWRRLVAEGEQEFRFLNSDVPNKLPGRFELYLFQPPDSAISVILAWRAADAIRGNVPIDDWAQRAAGTITGF
jgi:hypothetical protein